MVGGALGALTRYGVGVWLQAALLNTSLAGFPLATLLVNVVGSFLLSFTVTLGLVARSHLTLGSRSAPAS